MKIHKYKLRLCICLSWLLQIHEKINSEKSECEEFDKLIENSKRLLQDTPWMQSSNFSPNFKLFNSLLEKMHKGIPDEQQFFPVVFVISLLRHCPFNEIQGCDEIKEIDLDSLIVWARENKCLNSWSITKWAKYFRDFYWLI